MKIKILFVLMFLLTNSHIVFSKDLTLRYYIYVNQQQKGLMSLKIGNGTFHSEYYNVDMNDRIPFYYPKKSGRFDSEMYSSELSFDSISYDIFKRSQDVPQKLNIPAMYKRDGKSIMVNRKDGLAKLVFDQIPMVCLENILIGLHDGIIKETQPLFLYEESTKSQFIIYYEKKGTQKIRLNNKHVNAETLLFLRKNIPGQPPKTLFELNVCKKVPVRIASISKRWELNLYQMGKVQMDQFDRTDEFIKRAKVKIANHHGERGFFSGKLTNYKYTANKFVFNYSKIVSASKYQTNELVKKYLKQKYLKSNYSMSSRDSFLSGYYDPLKISMVGQNYSIFISDRKICSELKKSGRNIENSCWFETLQDSINISSDEFIDTIQSEYTSRPTVSQIENEGFVITQGEKKIDCNQALAHFKKHKPEMFSNTSNHKIYCLPGQTKSSMSVSIYFDRQIPVNYTSPEVKKIAVKYLAKMIAGSEASVNMNALNNALKRKKTQVGSIENDGYILDISAHIIRNYEKKLLDQACSQLKKRYTNANFSITRATPDYRSCQCTLSGESYIPQREVSMEDTLFMKNSMLRFFKHEIKTQGQFWIYPTVPDVSNLCW